MLWSCGEKPENLALSIIFWDCDFCFVAYGTLGQKNYFCCNLFGYYLFGRLGLPTYLPINYEPSLRGFLLCVTGFSDNNYDVVTFHTSILFGNINWFVSYWSRQASNWPPYRQVDGRSLQVPENKYTVVSARYSCYVRFIT